MLCGELNNSSAKICPRGTLRLELDSSHHSLVLVIALEVVSIASERCRRPSGIELRPISLSAEQGGALQMMYLPGRLAMSREGYRLPV